MQRASLIPGGCPILIQNALAKIKHQSWINLIIVNVESFFFADLGKTLSVAAFWIQTTHRVYTQCQYATYCLLGAAPSHLRTHVWKQFGLDILFGQFVLSVLPSLYTRGKESAFTCSKVEF